MSGRGGVTHRWVRRALAFEFLALAIGIWVAVALFQDHRMTSVHGVSLVVGVVVVAVPVGVRTIGREGSARADWLASFGTMVPMLGSFTIGGLAFGIPLLLLIVAGVLRFVATEEGRSLRGFVSVGFLGVGALLFVAGGLSMGPGMIVAPVGLVLIILGSHRLARVEGRAERAV